MTGTFNLLSKTAYDIRLSGAFQSNLRTAISGTGVLETFQTYRLCTKSVNPAIAQNSHSFIHKLQNFCQTREVLDLNSGESLLAQTATCDLRQEIMQKIFGTRRGESLKICKKIAWEAPAKNPSETLFPNNNSVAGVN